MENTVGRDRRVLIAGGGIGGCLAWLYSDRAGEKFQ